MPRLERRELLAVIGTFGAIAAATSPTLLEFHRRVQPSVSCISSDRDIPERPLAHSVECKDAEGGGTTVRRSSYHILSCTDGDVTSDDRISVYGMLKRLIAQDDSGCCGNTSPLRFE